MDIEEGLDILPAGARDNLQRGVEINLSPAAEFEDRGE